MGENRIYGGFDFCLVYLGCYREFMVGIEFSLGNYEFGGRIMVGFVFS